MVNNEMRRLAKDNITFYYRRLDEERRAAAVACDATIAQVHRDFVRHYEERLMLERFGVDTLAELPSSFGVMTRSRQRGMR